MNYNIICLRVSVYFAYFTYLQITTYFYLLDVYDPLILTILNEFRSFERSKKYFLEISQIFYFVKKYQITMENFYNFICMKLLILRFLPKYLTYLF